MIIELGPDPQPLRDRDRTGVLFDLGMGTPTVDVCVRSGDPDLIADLRAASGTPLFGAVTRGWPGAWSRPAHTASS